MSISIDEIGSVYGMYNMNSLSSGGSQVVTANDESTDDGDSYISTISSMDLNAAIPSENYNDLGRKLKAAAKTEESANSTEYAAVTESGDSGQDTEVQETSSAGGSGGGGSDADSDEEDTETEIVTINGQTYLQTTTTDSNGNVTVTKVPVGE